MAIRDLPMPREGLLPVLFCVILPIQKNLIAANVEVLEVESTYRPA